MDAAKTTTENFDIIVGVDGDGKDDGHDEQLILQKFCECLAVVYILLAG